MNDDELGHLVLRGEDNDEIISALNDLTPVRLALFRTNASVELRTKLDSEELSPVWENKFNDLTVTNVPNFRFRDPSPQSKAEFYCGYILYLAALQKKSHSKQEYVDYLMLAISNKSFYAYQELLSAFLTVCEAKATDRNLDEVLATLRGEESRLQQLKTPGCLLLANSYFQLALVAAKSGNKSLSRDCFKQAWSNLHLASLEEEASTKEIHNAYFGKGLKGSNAYDLSDISSMKDKFASTAQSELPAMIRTFAEEQARSIYKSHAGKKNESVEVEVELEDEKDNTSPAFK